MRRAGRWLAILSLCLSGAAHADVDDRLTAYETEARQLGTDLPQPNQVSGAAGQRRLVDAEIAYSLGDFDTAALMLFDIASKPGTDQETASFYLGESLYAKGDKSAARTYFAQIKSAASRYYQPSLERLVEIAIAQNDNTDVDQYLGALDRGPSGIYVRGKYAFSQGKLDEAMTYFGDVPAGSAYDYQAKYYLATTAVAKNDLARAIEIFTDLTTRHPKTSTERRVLELSQLALGRLYYEKDEPSKSIDAYLLVDRHSDLFADALYEVAWVYVKGKQYDKALRALELLSLSEPTSQKTPTVRILEGNLHIRKAQMVRNSLILGTQLDTRDKTDPETEYDRATAVFTETHDAYFPSYQALAQMVDANANPEQYLAQIAGRSPHVFMASAPLPEAAAQYLRDEPNVQRVVAEERDLADIQANLTESEATIARLEGVFAAGDRTAVYPALASRRSRVNSIQDELITIRNDLAESELRLVDGAGAAQLSATRKQLAQSYAANPNAEDAFAQRVAATRAQYDAIEQSSAEVSTALDSTQAVAVALRKYANDPPVEGQPAMPADQKATVTSTLDQVVADGTAIENELAELQRELVLARDLASVGDEGMAQARAARAQLKAAQDAEHRALAGMVGQSRDGKKFSALVALGDRAARLSDQLTQLEQQIDGIVDQGVTQAKVLLAQERTNIDGFKSELAEHETEATSIGGTVLGASFKDVKAKFYDVIIRTDVGNVDVSWSQKEDTDDDLKRLNLSRQRELKQLKDEFKDIINGVMPTTPATPAPVAPPATPPAASPDKGAPGGDNRVKPGTDVPQGTPLPNVKPDAAKGSR